MSTPCLASSITSLSVFHASDGQREASEERQTTALEREINTKKRVSIKPGTWNIPEHEKIKIIFIKKKNNKIIVIIKKKNNEIIWKKKLVSSLSVGKQYFVATN